MTERRNRFSIRKLTIGAVSVMFSALVFTVATNTAHADQVNSSAKTEQTTASNNNNNNNEAATKANSKDQLTADWDFSKDQAKNTITLNAYKGQSVDVVLPNNVDFENAGLLTADGKVIINRSLIDSFRRNPNLKTLDISHNGNGTVPLSSEDWRWGFQATPFASIDLSGLDISATNGSLDGMFRANNNLKTLNISNLQGHKVTRMAESFSNCPNLETIVGLSNLDTSAVTSFYVLFYGDSKLTNIGDISNWKTSNVENFFGMFYNDASLTNLGNLGKWNTDKVFSMYAMFRFCTSLTNVKLPTKTHFTLADFDGINPIVVLNSQLTGLNKVVLTDNHYCAGKPGRLTLTNQ